MMTETNYLLGLQEQLSVLIFDRLFSYFLGLLWCLKFNICAVLQKIIQFSILACTFTFQRSHVTLSL